MCEAVEPYVPRYVGVTTKGADIRARLHHSARHARWLQQCNSALAQWLEDVVPHVEILADGIPESDRYRAEATVIKKLAAEHILFNKYGNGFHHSAETRAKMSESQRRARKRRRALREMTPVAGPGVMTRE
ncbi:MAG: hypothetical protein ACRDPY_46935 [Streptosporangiaceae bacterium]